MIRPSIPEDNIRSFSQAMLSGLMYSLIADGYSGKALQAKLEEANKGFDPPVSQDYLLELIESYLEKEPLVSPIKMAIASNDVKELFRVAPLLAQLSPLNWGIVKREIKERYGRHVNLNDLVSAVKDEQRKHKLQEEGINKDIADIAREWASEHRGTWGYDTVYEMWRIWNGSYWIEQAKDHQLNKEAIAAIQHAGKHVDSRSSLMLFKEAVEADCIRDFTPEPGLINFDNGTLQR